MSKAKRYYWLKLPEDFFDNEAIEWLEEQENGKAYCLFYLKLCLKGINSGGILIRQVGKMLLPYDTNKLAEITRTSIDTAIIALELLQNIGLIEICQNGEIYIPIVKEMVGSETSDAVRKRKKRKEGKNRITTTNEPLKITENNITVEQCADKFRTNSGICPIDKEKEKELLSKDNNNSFDLNFNNNLIDNKKCEMPIETKAVIAEIKKNLKK